MKQQILIEALEKLSKQGLSVAIEALEQFHQSKEENKSVGDVIMENREQIVFDSLGTNQGHIANNKDWVQIEQSRQHSDMQWVYDSISWVKLTIERLEVNCFDEDSEMSIRVGKSTYQSITVDEAKELANFILSHIKNETEANPPKS